MLKTAERLGGFGVWEVDAASGSVRWSAGLFRMHDLEPGDPLPLDDAIDFYEADYRPMVRAAVGRCLGEGVPFEFEARLHSATGRRFWVRATGEAEVDGSGVVRRIYGAALDITAWKNAEEALRESNRRRELLYHEMDHRMRNTLAALSALVTRASREEADREAMAATVRRRIDAIARVHSLLTRSHFEAVPLSRIAEAASGQAGGLAGARAVSWSGPEVAVPPRQVPAMTIVLCELVHNSAKHGALGRAGGRIEIAWSAAGDGDGEGACLIVTTTERGGPGVASPPSPGTGLGLVEGLVSSDLRGTAEFGFGDEGARHRLALTLDCPAG